MKSFVNKTIHAIPPCPEPLRCAGKDFGRAGMTLGFYLLNFIDHSSPVTGLIRGCLQLILSNMKACLHRGWLSKRVLEQWIYSCMNP
jgi:hypothetical protein